MHSSGVSAAALPDMRGYWKTAPLLVIGIFAVVAVRLHEFVPLARLIKPVLTLSVFGTAILLSKTSRAARQAALRHPLMKLMFAYIVWMLMTVPTAIWKGQAFGTARGFLPPLLMVLAVLLVAPNRRNLDRLQTGFVVLVLLYAAYAQTFGSSWKGRLQIGGMFDSNDMASLMALGFPLAAGLLARSAPGRARVAAILGVVALGLGIIATGSRGGVLALGAGVVVFALGFRGARAPAVVMALFLAGAVGWFTAPASFRNRMLTLTDLEGDYNYTSQSGRKQVWARGRGYIKDHPIFGVGAGNFPIVDGTGLAALGLTGKWSAAHNAYIQSYAELGIPGGSLFVALLIVAGVRARRMWRVPPSASRKGALDRPEFLGSLGAFAAGGYFLSHAYFPPAFALLGMIALADRVRSTERARPATLVQRAAPNLARRGERGGLAARVALPTASLPARVR